MFTSMSTKDMSEEDLADLFKKTQDLESQNKDLESQIDLVLNAKNNLEKILSNERKITEDLREQLKAEQNKPQAEPAQEEETQEDSEQDKLEQKYQSEIAYLISLIQISKQKSLDLENEVKQIKADHPGELTKKDEEIQAS